MPEIIPTLCNLTIYFYIIARRSVLCWLTVWRSEWHAYKVKESFNTKVCPNGRKRDNLSLYFVKNQDLDTWGKHKYIFNRYFSPCITPKHNVCRLFNHHHIAAKSSSMHYVFRNVVSSHEIEQNPRIIFLGEHVISVERLSFVVYVYTYNDLFKVQQSLHFEKVLYVWRVHFHICLRPDYKLILFLSVESRYWC